MAALEKGKHFKILKKGMTCFGKRLVVTISECSRPDGSYRFTLRLGCISEHLEKVDLLGICRAR